jgi:hypothetical protein
MTPSASRNPRGSGVKRPGLPLFGKPRAGGTAFGVTQVWEADTLPTARKVAGQ